VKALPEVLDIAEYDKIIYIKTPRALTSYDEHTRRTENTGKYI